MSEYFIAVWCVHPDLILQEMTVTVPEPETPFVAEPPLYLRRHELIDSELSALRYLVCIRLWRDMTGARCRPPPMTCRRGTLMTAMTLTGSMGAVMAAPRCGLDSSAVTGKTAAMGTPAVQTRLSRAGGPHSGPSNR